MNLTALYLTNTSIVYTYHESLDVDVGEGVTFMLDWCAVAELEVDIVVVDVTALEVAAETIHVIKMSLCFRTHTRRC